MKRRIIKVILLVLTMGVSGCAHYPYDDGYYDDGYYYDERGDYSYSSDYYDEDCYEYYCD